MAEAVAEEYRSSLSDLNFNSKPHINMLTMLAEENIKYAPVIVKTVLTHVETVPPDLKLPSLYLVDSIMKNIGGLYIELFSKHMVTLFTSVFAKVQEATRMALYKLRQTWNVLLPDHILHGIDVAVHKMDPAWPITTPPPVVVPASPTIHINPKFLGQPKVQQLSVATQQPVGLTGNTQVPSMLEKAKEPTQNSKQFILQQIREKKMQLSQQAVAPKQPHAGIMPSNIQIPKRPTGALQDPRLTRSALVTNPIVDAKTMDKNSLLQSIVIVPSGKSAIDEAHTHPNNSHKLLTTTNNKSDAVLGKNAGSIKHENRNNGEKIKAERKSPDKKNAKESPKQSNTSQVHSPKASKGKPKKRSMSPEKKAKGDTPKKVCKSLSSENKLKRTHSNEDPKFENGISKKGKPNTKKSESKPDGRAKQSHFVKSSKIIHEKSGIPTDSISPSLNENTTEEKAFSTDDGSTKDPLLFGSKDKDYRQMMRNNNNVLPKLQPPSFLHGAITSNDLVSHSPAESQKMDLETKYFSNQMPPGSRNSPVNWNSESVSSDHPSVHSEVGNLERLNDSSRIPDSKANTDQAPFATAAFSLDGKNRPIHIVNRRAFIMTDNNDPREVSFIGPPRKVFVDGHCLSSPLGFKGQMLEFETNGMRNTIQFGVPTHEVYINNIPYNAQFGGQPFIAILEDKKKHQILIKGPPPQLVVSEQPAYDILDEFNAYMNAASQRNDFKRQDDALSQDVDMRVKGGIVSARFNDHQMMDMDWRQSSIGNPALRENSNSIPPNSLNDFGPSAANEQLQRPIPSEIPARLIDPPSSKWMPSSFPELKPPPIPAFNALLQNKPSPWELQPPPMPPVKLQPLALLPTPMRPSVPAVPMMQPVSLSQPQWPPLQPPPIFTGNVPLIDKAPPAVLPTPVTNPPVLSQPSSLPPPTTSPCSPINVSTIYDKLVAAGIIPKKIEKIEPVEPPVEVKAAESPRPESPFIKEEVVPDIRLTPKALRVFYPGVISALFKGSQCATCGMRFKEIQSQQYSRHLDWHFRTNRREKDGAKKAFSRRLYYEIKDWISFNEIEEVEERAPSYFELQGEGAILKNAAEKICSVPASEFDSEKCSVCGDQFQLFWVEEEEEWHLRHAVRHDGEAYHPTCYEDFKKASKSPVEEEAPEVNEDPDVTVKEEPDDAEEASSNNIAESSSEEKDCKKETAEEEMEIDVKPDLQELESNLAKEAKTPDDAPKATSDDKVRDVCDPPDKESAAASADELDKSDSKAGIEMDVEENVGGESKMAAHAEDNDDGTSMKSSEEKGPQEERNCEQTEVPEDVANPKESELVEGKPLVEEKKDADVVEEDDFRPPTPDPRFQVLPPTVKGTELSALCSIM